MKTRVKTSLVAATLAAIGLSSAMLWPSAASAAERGMSGSYLGGGLSGGLGINNADRDDTDLAGGVQGRYVLPQTARFNAPLSLRTGVLFNKNSFAVAPTATYDLPIASKTNLYGSAGYAFVNNSDSGRSVSPLGDRNSVVLNASVERELNNRFLTYGDAKWTPNGFEGGGSGFNIQGGIGYRF